MREWWMLVAIRFAAVWIPILIVAGALSGCLVPIPGSTQFAPSIRGVVVHAGSREPLTEAEVEHCYGERICRGAKTQRDGSFRIPPLKAAYWATLYGPLSHRLYLAGEVQGRMSLPVVTTLYVKKPGYETKPISLEFYRSSADNPPQPIPNPDWVEIHLKRQIEGNSEQPP